VGKFVMLMGDASEVAAAVERIARRALHSEDASLHARREIGVRVPYPRSKGALYISAAASNRGQQVGTLA
jgi:hypothetical protein